MDRINVSTYDVLWSHDAHVEGAIRRVLEYTNECRDDVNEIQLQREDWRAHVISDVRFSNFDDRRCVIVQIDDDDSPEAAIVTITMRRPDKSQPWDVTMIMHDFDDAITRIL